MLSSSCTGLRMAAASAATQSPKCSWPTPRPLRPAVVHACITRHAFQVHGDHMSIRFSSAKPTGKDYSINIAGCGNTSGATSVGLSCGNKPQHAGTQQRCAQG
jgi:hypothetical protein